VNIKGEVEEAGFLQGRDVRSVTSPQEADIRNGGLLEVAGCTGSRTFRKFENH
jgi:hypothetical protein